MSMNRAERLLQIAEDSNAALAQENVKLTKQVDFLEMSNEAMSDCIVKLRQMRTIDKGFRETLFTVQGTLEDTIEEQASKLKERTIQADDQAMRIVRLDARFTNKNKIIMNRGIRIEDQVTIIAKLRESLAASEADLEQAQTRTGSGEYLSGVIDGLRDTIEALKQSKQVLSDQLNTNWHAERAKDKQIEDLTKDLTNRSASRKILEDCYDRQFRALESIRKIMNEEQ